MAALDTIPLRYPMALQMLSEDEQAKSAAFRFERDRKRFIARHRLLRIILSRYLNKEPYQLDFYCEPYGKPTLTSRFNGDALCFNMSHSNGVALYAVSYNRRVGVDIEHIRSDLANMQVAERFFSPREVAVLRALPSDTREEAFFNCWTRKEAYIKATGKGLSLPLDQFDVTLAPREPAALLCTRGDPDAVFRWSLQELRPGPGYVAALAVEGASRGLKCWRWSG
jgi:4'-phosphopantetheinyl transferase